METTSKSNYSELEYDNDRFCKVCFIERTRCDVYKKLRMHNIFPQILEIKFINSNFFIAYCIIPKNNFDTFKSIMNDVKNSLCSNNSICYEYLAILRHFGWD